MGLKQFSIIRLLILLAIGIIILAAFLINNLYLAIFGFLIGILFIFAVRNKYKQEIIDERVLTISGQAARWTYLYTTLIFSVFAILLIFPGQHQENAFNESLGVIFSYLAIFNIALYAIFFHYFNKKHGGHR